NISIEDSDNRKLALSHSSKSLWDYYKASYRYSEKANMPCNDYYYVSHGVLTKNIIASDLGIIAKTNYHGNYMVAVTSINSAEPVSGAKVNLYAQNQKLIT